MRLESGESLLYKNNTKMAELPKDINPTDKLGCFLYLRQKRSSCIKEKKMKKQCSIHFMVLLVSLLGFGSTVLAKGDSVKASVPGNTVVQDLAVDLMLINCDPASPEQICSLPPGAPQDMPAWLDIKAAKITEVGENQVDLSISLYEPVPQNPPVQFVSYYWQFQDGCTEPSPTDKNAIFVYWDGNTNTWSGYWSVITSCNPRSVIIGAQVQFKFTDDGIKVRVSLDDLISNESQSLKWYAGVRRLPFVHPKFTHTWPLDVAPRVIDINSSPPPFAIFPEASANWDQR
jgi:hypothetical protein